MSEPASRAVTVFNVFTPKTERLAGGTDAETAVLPALPGQVPGLLGSRSYVSVDNRTAVVMSVWERFSHFEQFRDSGGWPY